MKLDFPKMPKYQISWNPAIGSRVVPCGRTERQAQKTKLIVTFRNFANVPNNESPRNEIIIN
jgi:hypothetical protein